MPKVLVKTIPYRVHTVLTDNGSQFVRHEKRSESDFVVHISGAVCAANGIEHRQAKPHHPRTDGQAERMAWTTKDATVKSLPYASISGRWC